MLYLALGVSAFTEASGLVRPSASVSSSLSLLVGAGAVLYATVVELTQAVLLERDRLALARAETSRAVARLVEQTRAHGEVAHNTKNALAAIDGGLHMLSKRSGTSDQTWVLAALRSEMKRLAIILERPETHEQIAPFDVCQVIAPMISCYRAAEQPVSMINYDQPWALGRPGDTAEVLQNLIENSLRHAPGSEVTVTISVDEGHAFLAVSDDGDGIVEEDRGRIFESGYRGRGARGVGNGTGLYSCRTLLQSQGGSIQLVESRRGTRFEIRLPLAADGREIIIDLTDHGVDRAERLETRAVEPA